MYPVLARLHFNSVTLFVTTYGVWLALAVFVGALLFVRAARWRGADPNLALALCASVVMSGFAGAFFLQCGVAVGLSWNTSALDFLTVAAKRLGISVYGGMLAGTAALYLLGPRFGMRRVAAVNAAVVPFALSHALGRLGCFFAGCCYGKHTDWALGVRYPQGFPPDASAPLVRHPVPLYEALLALALAWIFSLRGQNDNWHRPLQYLALYALGRFFLEYLRADEGRGLFWGGALSTAQVISCGLLLGAGVLAAKTQRAKALQHA